MLGRRCAGPHAALSVTTLTWRRRFKTIWLRLSAADAESEAADVAWLLLMDQIGSVVGYVAFARERFASAGGQVSPPFRNQGARARHDHARLERRGRLFVRLRVHAAGGVRRRQLGLYRHCQRSLSDVRARRALGIIYNTARGVQFSGAGDHRMVAARLHDRRRIALAGAFALLAVAMVWTLPETKASVDGGVREDVGQT